MDLWTQQPGLADSHRADPGLDRPFRHMAVPNETLSAIVCGEMRMGGKAFGKFGFNSLRQKLARSVPQNLGERIGKLSRLAQGNNLIVLHGVSILFWMCGWLVTATIRRLPYSAPSPTLLHSSTRQHQTMSIGSLKILLA
jgi:hypothetical protein